MIGRPFRAPVKSSQRGAVLIVVLVLLVAAIFLSMGVMRGTLTSDLVTNNTRVQTLATEAAQLALRFCEDDLEKALGSGGAQLFADSEGKPNILPKADKDQPMAWLQKANWVTEPLKAHPLKPAHFKSGSTRMLPSKMPECLAEYSSESGTDQIVVLTVRGFSPDYQPSDDDSVSSGSVVWLQSRLVFSITSGE